MIPNQVQRAFDVIALWVDEPDSVSKRNALAWATPILQKYEEKIKSVKTPPTDFKKLYEQERLIREDYEHLYEEAIKLLHQAGVDPEEPVRQSTLRMYRRKVEELEQKVKSLERGTHD